MEKTNKKVTVVAKNQTETTAEKTTQVVNIAERERLSKIAIAEIATALSVKDINDIHTASAVVYSADKFANLSLIAKIKAIAVIKSSNMWKNAYSQTRRKKFTNFYDYAQEIARIGKTTANKYVQAGEYIDENGNILLPKANGVTVEYSAEMLLTLVEMIRANKGANAEKILEMLKNGVVTPCDTVEYAKKTIKGRLSGKIKDLTDDESTADEIEETPIPLNLSGDDTAKAIIIARRWAKNADFMEMLYAYDKEHTAD